MPAIVDRRFRVLAALLIACLPQHGRSQQTVPVPAGDSSTASPGHAALQAIFSSDEAWRRSQVGAVSEADEAAHLDSAHLPHVDPATQEAELRHFEAVLRQLDALQASQLSGTDHLNLEVFRTQIVSILNQDRFREYEQPANSDTMFWQLAPFSDQPLRTAEDYRRYLSRLRDIPQFFAENEANMRAGLARGFTPPRVTLEGRDASIRSVSDAATPEATPFWKPLAATMPASIPPAQQEEFRAAARQILEQQVIPAYKGLLVFFDQEYVPHARTTLAATSLPNGREYYQSKILEFATVTDTPEQIHALGLAEMAKIHAEMLSVMRAAAPADAQAEAHGISPGHEDLGKFLQFLRSDPRFYVQTPQELLNRAAWIAKEFDNVSARYFGYQPRGRFGIVPVPPEIAPFYTAGRGGEHEYLLNTYDLPSRPLYALPALTLHESAPGHSWQGNISDEQAREQHRPEFRKAYISAYGEGWALYCERLGDEMGIYHTPYERFGMLSYQAWRAARLVVDTGIHAQGWTRAQAQQYLRDNTALSDHEIETEVDRYISWPGQALSYYLGELAIQNARRQAETRLGQKFNIRAFHDEVLSLGSVPLPVLTEQVNLWIQGGGIGPYPEMER